MDNTERLAERWNAWKDRLANQLDVDADALQSIDGDYQALVDSLAKKSRWTRARARREVDAAIDALAAGDGNGLGSYAREQLAPGAAKVREGLGEMAQGAAHVRDQAIDRARDTLRGVGQDAGEIADRGARGVSRALARAETFVRERPFTSMGLAFAAGWLLLRRR